MMKKTPETNGAERLHKLIARAGISSRRAAEEIVTQGRVTVNGIVVKELGAKADPTVDRIAVDGQPLKLSPGTSTVILLHKPAGVVSTKKDPEGRTTVLHLMPEKYKHLHPIGRLDYDTSGVIFLTDDGDLTHLLTHPSHGVDKVYWARVGGTVTVDTLKKLEMGIFLEDGKTAPCRARVRAQTEKNALVQLILREGRNRQVRRMLDAVGHPVKALRRVKIADFGLDGLLPGEYRVLIDAEVHMLRKAAESKTKVRSSKPPVKTKAKAALSAKSAAEGKAGEVTKPARVAKPNAAVRASSTAKALREEAAAPVKSRRSPQAMPTRTSIAFRDTGTSRGSAKDDRYSSTDESKVNGRRTPRSDADDSRAPRSSVPRTSTRAARSETTREDSHPLSERVARRFSQNTDAKPFAPELPSRTRRRESSVAKTPRKTSFDDATAKPTDKAGGAKPANKKPDSKASKAKAAQDEKYASKARRGARAWGGKTRKHA